MAPEVLTGNVYSESADIYSMALVSSVTLISLMYILVDSFVGFMGDVNWEMPL